MKIMNGFGQTIGAISEDVYNLLEDPFCTKFCPKCGRDDLSIRFNQAVKDGDKSVDNKPLEPKQEFLRIKCLTCEFTWNAMPLDQQHELLKGNNP